VPKGRPLTEDQRFKIVTLFQGGKGPDEIAKQLDISAITVRNIVRDAMAAETHRAPAGEGEDLEYSIDRLMDEGKAPAAIAADVACDEATVYQRAADRGFEWDYQEGRWITPAAGPVVSGADLSHTLTRTELEHVVRFVNQLEGRDLGLMQAAIERLVGRVNDLGTEVMDLRRPLPGGDRQTLALQVFELSVRAHESSHSAKTLSLAWDLRRWALTELTGVDPDSDEPF